VKKYGGKFILRIEDTNSDNIDIPSYDLIADRRQLDIRNIKRRYGYNPTGCRYYYDYAEKFLEIGNFIYARVRRMHSKKTGGQPKKNVLQEYKALTKTSSMEGRCLISVMDSKKEKRY